MAVDLFLVEIHRVLNLNLMGLNHTHSENKPFCTRLEEDLMYQMNVSNYMLTQLVLQSTLNNITWWS